MTYKQNRETRISSISIYNNDLNNLYYKTCKWDSDFFTDMYMITNTPNTLYGVIFYAKFLQVTLMCITTCIYACIIQQNLIPSSFPY